MCIPSTRIYRVPCSLQTQASWEQFQQSTYPHINCMAFRNVTFFETIDPLLNAYINSTYIFVTLQLCLSNFHLNILVLEFLKILRLHPALSLPSNIDQVMCFEPYPLHEMIFPPTLFWYRVETLISMCMCIENVA